MMLISRGHGASMYGLVPVTDQIALRSWVFTVIRRAEEKAAGKQHGRWLSEEAREGMARFAGR